MLWLILAVLSTKLFFREHTVFPCLYFDLSRHSSQTWIQIWKSVMLDNRCLAGIWYISFALKLVRLVESQMNRAFRSLPDTNSTMLSSSPVSPLILSVRAPKRGAYFWNLSLSFGTNRKMSISKKIHLSPILSIKSDSWDGCMLLSCLRRRCLCLVLAACAVADFSWTSATSSAALIADQYLWAAPSLQKAMTARGPNSSARNPFLTQYSTWWHRRPCEKDGLN